MTSQRLTGPTSWLRGPLLGKGGYGSVHMAVLKTCSKRKSGSDSEPIPTLLAVKSASEAFNLVSEEQILGNLRGCPNIIRCYGTSVTLDKNGDPIFNLFLEYASAGTLLDHVRQINGGRGLPESVVRLHARSVLLGLQYIHYSGYVHCDLKPENILLFPKSGDMVAKIGDFGLAKERWKRTPVRGTTMYVAPESYNHGYQEAPADIWAFGCTVLELFTGKRPWEEEREVWWTNQDLRNHIAYTGDVPAIPSWLSPMATDFLEHCLVRLPYERWTAEDLLNHPFVADLDAGKPTARVEEKVLSPEYSVCEAAAKRRRPCSEVRDVIVISSD